MSAAAGRRKARPSCQREPQSGAEPESAAAKRCRTRVGRRKARPSCQHEPQSEVEHIDSQVFDSALRLALRIQWRFAQAAPRASEGSPPMAWWLSSHPHPSRHFAALFSAAEIRHSIYLGLRVGNGLARAAVSPPVAAPRLTLPTYGVATSSRPSLGAADPRLPQSVTTDPCQPSSSMINPACRRRGRSSCSPDRDLCAHGAEKIRFCSSNCEYCAMPEVLRCHTPSEGFGREPAGPIAQRKMLIEAPSVYKGNGCFPNHAQQKDHSPPLARNNPDPRNNGLLS